MFVQTSAAPNTPLNLQLNVRYAPRVNTPPYVAFEAREQGPGRVGVFALEDGGVETKLFEGTMGEAWTRLATHLRMDLPGACRKGTRR